MVVSFEKIAISVLLMMSIINCLPACDKAKYPKILGWINGDHFFIRMIALLDDDLAFAGSTVDFNIVPF